MPRQKMTDVLRIRILVRKDSPAHSISLVWIKTILVASQFFAFKTRSYGSVRGALSNERPYRELVVGIEGGVVSGVINLESSGVEASDWRPRYDEPYHEA
jgi:hypothetical protein